MRYLALACDYDGTIATDGRVDKATIEAFKRLRESGRKLILVTGRHLEDLLKVFPDIALFDRVVVENGALLYRPATREEKALGGVPRRSLGRRDRDVSVHSVMRPSLISTHTHISALTETRFL
jgi:HAD superfamily hydrolase (TIGR01484 family)